MQEKPRLDTLLSVSNPVFRTYVICVVILSLKMTMNAWHQVQRFMSSSGYGMRNPEDLKPGPLNPRPNPQQIKPFEPVERLRRIMGHDLENNLGFFMVGYLYALLNAGEAWPLWLYTGCKMLHHVVYLTAQPHEVRATCWTVMNMAFVYMCFKVLTAVL